VNVELVGAHRLRVREGIVRFGGIVASYAGDGELIYTEQAKTTIFRDALTKVVVASCR
jgi:hypothetical protein